MPGKRVHNAENAHSSRERGRNRPSEASMIWYIAIFRNDRWFINSYLNFTVNK